MIDEAVKSLRALFVSSLALLLLWVVSWPAAVEKIERYPAVLDLHAWLYLRDALGRMQGSVLDQPADQPVTADVQEQLVMSQGGDVVEVPVPLRVRATWPGVAEIPLTLDPDPLPPQAFEPEMADRVRVYRVQAPSGALPLSSYYAVWADRPEPAIVHQGDPEFERDRGLGLRHLMAASRARHLPGRWDDLALHLVKHGFTGRPAELSAQDAALAKLREESDPRTRSGGVQFFGVQFSLASFFSLFGLFLAAIAFGTLGPILALRRQPGAPAREVWVLLAPAGRGVARLALEGCILAVTAAWAAAPLVVLFMQVATVTRVPGVVAGWSVLLGGGGLVFSSLVFGAAGWELRRCRRVG